MHRGRDPWDMGVRMRGGAGERVWGLDGGGERVVDPTGRPVKQGERPNLF